MTTTLLDLISWTKVLLKHLWFSITSIKFYQDILNAYQGYGIKYIFTISFLSSLLCSALVLNQVCDIKNYFTYNVISNNTTNIDYIINQFPDLNFDGQVISYLSEKNITYLTNTNNYVIVAIDPANTLSYYERSKIPIVLTSNKIVLTFINPGEKPLYTFSLDYNKIFTELDQNINQTLLKASLAEVLKGTPEIFIYIFFPLLVFLVFLKALMEKSFIIIIIYLLTTIFSIKISLKTCTRLVLFASGIFYLLQPLILLVSPTLNFLIWLMQIWSNLLFIIAVLKTYKRFQF